MIKGDKLTENDTVILLKERLEKDGWFVGNKFCLGQKRGIDIEAVKGDQVLMIEVKGAKANDTSPTKKREYFNSGQIKIHFGEAIVKVLNDKYNNPNAQFAIAHPDDEDVKRAIGHLIPFLRQLDIMHYWVSSVGVIQG